MPLALLVRRWLGGGGGGRYIHGSARLAGLEREQRLVGLAAREIRLVGDDQAGRVEGDARRRVERHRGVVRAGVLLSEPGDLDSRRAELDDLVGGSDQRQVDVSRGGQRAAVGSIRRAALP